MLAAQMMGVIEDGATCFVCAGKGFTEAEGKDKNCTECDEGIIRPPAPGWVERIENVEDLQDTIQMIYQSREKPLGPNEWLSTPAPYIAAYRLLAPYLFGEFEDRRKARETPDAK